VPAPVLCWCSFAVLTGLFCAAPALAETPTFHADTTTIAATGDLVWNVGFTIRNPQGVGFYLDSLYLDVDDMGPLEPGRVKRTTQNVSPVLRAIDNVSAGEETTLQFSGPAQCERADLTFRLYAHDANKQPFSYSELVHAVPGPYSDAFPSDSIVVGGKHVEFLLVPARGTARPAPGILVVHDHGASARRQLMQALTLSARGYAVGLVSQPGYGASQGPADWCGPATVAAVNAALDRMKRSGSVDTTRLAIWGLGRGATVGALVVSRRKDVKTLIAESGVYDLAGACRGDAGSALRAQVLAEAGKDSAAWRARSPVYEVSKLGASALLLHGEADPLAPAAQARAYAALAQASNHSAEVQVAPGVGRPLPWGVSMRPATAFLKHQFGN
jgi:pimeloyl-ACP methyl ester carboxylesterase